MANRGSRGNGWLRRWRWPALAGGLALVGLGLRRGPPLASESGERYKSPIQMAVSGDGEWLYVVCEESDEVLVVDVAGRRVVAAIPVGRAPFGAALSADGRRLYVSVREDDDVAEIDLRSHVVARRVAVGDNPHGLALDGADEFLYVTNMSSNDVSVVETASLTEIKRLTAGRSPFDAALSPDGRRLFVSNQLSAPVPPGSPPVLELTVIDPERQMVVERRQLPSTVVGQGVAVSPDGQLAIVALEFPKNLIPETQIYQGWMVTAGFAVAETRPGGSVAYLLIDEPNRYFSDPFDPVFTPDGRFLLISSSGVNAVTVVDVRKVRELLRIGEKGQIGVAEATIRRYARHLGLSDEYVAARIETGWNPKGMTASPDGRTVFVANRLSDTITVIDVIGQSVTATIELGGPREITAERRGSRLFNHSAISFQRQLSCNTCHPEMHVDGLAYDIAIDGIGRNLVDNLTLRGLKGTAPFKWSGKNPTLHRQEGPRAAQLFFRSHGFDEGERRDLVQFIESIPRPRNRSVREGGGLDEFQRRGKSLFERAYTNDGRYIASANRCVSCHPPPLFTDRKKHNVGSRAYHDDHRDFDTPHLANLYEGAPYMHDGRCFSLEEIWTVFNPDDTHGATNDMTKAQLNDLIAYILTF